MAALGSQSIASSYEQLLHVDRDGGGNSTTHVSIKDGDNGTTFGFTIATDALMMSSTNRLEFGDTGTYIHQSADGVLDLVSDTEIEINATTIDINGAVAMDGAMTGGTNITISGELDAATLDISGNADIAGTTNLDAVDIDGAVDMASTLAVAGATTITSTDNSVNLTLKSTDTDASSGPILDLFRDSAAALDDDYLGIVRFSGKEASDGDTANYAQIIARALDVTAGTPDGRLEFEIVANDSGTTAMSIAPNAANEGYGVGIGTTSPDNKFQIEFADGSNTNAGNIAADSVTGIQLTNTTDSDGNGTMLLMESNNGSNQTAIGHIQDDGTSAHMAFYTELSGTLSEKMRIQHDGKIGIASAAASPSHIVDVTANDGVSDNNAVARFVNAEATDGRSKGVYIRAGSTADDWPLYIDDHDASNNLLSLRGNGALTAPKTPAFCVKASSATDTNANSSTHTVAWGTEIFDQGSNFASNTFTAPVTGKYQLNLSLAMTDIDTGASYIRVDVVTSNNTYINIIVDPNYSADLSYLGGQLTVLADMDASDTATVGINVGGGDSVTNITNNSVFSGFLAC